MNMLMVITTGEGAIDQLLWLLAVLVCGLIVWLLGKNGLPKLKAPPGVLTAWDWFFVVLAALLAINFILGLFGHPLLRL